jgi:ankyrin repeat protein
MARKKKTKTGAPDAAAKKNTVQHQTAAGKKATRKPREQLKKTDALMQACGSEGSLQEVKRWLAEGADVNAVRGRTPLQVACGCGNYEVVRLLLQAGADPNKGSRRETPLIAAALGGKSNLRIMKLLIEKGAEADIETKDAGRALAQIIESSPFDIAVATFLIDNGADIECLGRWRDSTALSLAADKGHLDLVKYLLKKGADINHRIDPHGHTALDNAIRNDNREMVMYLLEAGADPAIKPRHGADVFVYAAGKAYTDILDLLENKGFPLKADKQRSGKALVEAIAQGNLKMVELLLERGANPNACDNQGNPPLFTAAAEGRLPIVRLLVKSGADVHARNKHNWNALMNACRNPKAETATFLIKKGCDIEPVEKQRGMTPLILAAEQGHVEVVKVLIAAGANLEARAKNGRTALTWARISKQNSIVRLLKIAGAEEQPERYGNGGEICGLCGRDLKTRKRRRCSECHDSFCVEHFSFTEWAYPHQTVDDKYREVTCPNGHTDHERED